MKLELDLQSPYQPDGSPRTDLPTGEVLGWNGSEWLVGYFGKDHLDRLYIGNDYDALFHVRHFSVLPTIIEQDDLL